MSLVLRNPHRRRPRTSWAETHLLPAECIARLDAEGKVRGATWRDMPGYAHRIEDEAAMAWFFWKRNMLYSDTDLRTCNFAQVKFNALLALGAGEAAMEA